MWNEWAIAERPLILYILIAFICGSALATLNLFVFCGIVIFINSVQRNRFLAFMKYCIIFHHIIFQTPSKWNIFCKKKCGMNSIAELILLKRVQQSPIYRNRCSEPDYFKNFFHRNVDFSVGVCYLYIVWNQDRRHIAHRQIILRGWHFDN